MPEYVPDFEKLVDAIYVAEGGAKAKVPYGILSVKVKDEAEARRVALNTARNNYTRWQKAGQPGDYIDFLADRYVPVSADPQGNANWKVNVKKLYAPPPRPAPVAVMAPVLPAYPPLKR